MGFYAAIDCLYLIAGNLKPLRNVGSYLPELVATYPRRIIYRYKLTSYEIGD
jgi:hypothetical protein